MPKKALTLTLVIPALNEERYLADCLRSVASQIEMPDEVIVVDNDSTDQTTQIAKRFKFVKLLHEPKRGVANARGRGFDSAKGDIIARIDADSHLPADWVRRVKAEFTANSELAAATGPAGGYDLPLARSNWLAHHLLCWSLEKLPHAQPFLFGFNMAIRRSAWQKVRSQVCADNHVHEDLDLAIHLARSGLKIKYSKNIRLNASGRRYSMPWRDFHFYMHTYARTYHRHGIYSCSIYLAIATYYLGYLLYRPWVASWPVRPSPVG